MKFSDIKEEDWTSLAPYVDTCLLPVTGLSGSELPWEATAALELLRDALDALEIPYRGRVITYPALHYCPDPDGEWGEAINQISGNLKSAGFRFVIIVSIHQNIAKFAVPEADCVLIYDPLQSENSKQFGIMARDQVEQLWRGTLHEWK